MFDKLLDKIGLGNDYDDYDDEDVYDDGDDFYDEPKKPSRGSLFSSRNNDADDSVADNKPIRSLSKSAPKTSSSSKVSTFGGLEVCVIKPKSIDEASEITDTLKEGKAVVLNLEGLRAEVSQRIIDFSAGTSYSLDGSLQKITGGIFVITPPSVSISGDFSEFINNSETGFASTLNDKITTHNLDY